jgi:hypothetical protein
MTPQDTLRHHVTGAIERGEAQAITGMPAQFKLMRYGTRGKWGVLETPACRWAFTGTRADASAYFEKVSR